MKLQKIIVLSIAVLLLSAFQVSAAPNMAKQLKGRILLQVEANGEAWYVNPTDAQRYFLGRPADAFRVMRELGLGISEKSYYDFRGVAPENLSGRILLRVENNGEAYYVNPADRKMHYLGRPADAFQAMRELGLGITNANLNLVPVSSNDYVKNETLDFVNNYMLSGSSYKAEIIKLTKQGRIYFLEMKIEDQIIQSAVTDDVEYFFPSYFTAGDEIQINSEVEAELAATAIIEKNDLTGNDYDLKSTGLNAYGYYNIEIRFVENNSLVYGGITEDGVFFPSSINVEANKMANSGKPYQAVADDMVSYNVTGAKPKVELFVMSHCPYGVQMEKGLIPVVRKLGDKIEFELKFVDYAMHGEKEVYEQLTQYCIQKNEPEKLLDYLECFMLDGDQSRCLVEANINANILGQCKTETDTLHGLSADLDDKSTWSGNFPPFSIHEADCDKYRVQGSPTLVINGEYVQSQRDSQSLLNTVCSYFDAKPSECSSQLESASPSPGFGEYGYSGTGAATCN